MKKIIFILCAILTCVLNAQAQVVISTSDLDGTKWELVASNNLWPDLKLQSEASKENNSRQTSQRKPYYEYTQGSMIWHKSDATTATFPYYLSDAIPTKFDHSRVGKSTKGCYYIEYNSKLDEFICYLILSFNKTEGTMVHKLENEEMVGDADTFTFKLKQGGNFGGRR